MRSSRPIVLSLARARDPLHHLEPAHAGHASIRPVPSEGVLIKLQAVFVVIVIAALAGSQTSEVHAQADYTLFESGPVRPVAMSPDGNRVFVTNTPDGYLEIFDVSGGFAAKGASVPVGLEPVAVAARNDDEVWVVNHVSDSISVVDVSAVPPRVVRGPADPTGKLAEDPTREGSTQSSGT